MSDLMVNRDIDFLRKEILPKLRDVNGKQTSRSALGRSEALAGSIEKLLAPQTDVSQYRSLAVAEATRMLELASLVEQVRPEFLAKTTGTSNALPAPFLLKDKESADPLFLLRFIQSDPSPLSP